MSVRAVVLLALAAVLLAACGGSKSEQTAPPATTASAPPATTETSPQATATPATAGLTIDDPGPGDALSAFVEAAGAGDTDALWSLLTPLSQKQLGPTRADFARKYGKGFREGVGTFSGTPYEMVISRRDEGGWGVAAIAGNRVRDGKEEFATYGAAARQDGGKWLLELGAPLELTRLADAAPGTIAVEMSATDPMEAAGLWLDGEALPAHVEGRRARFVVAAQLPGEAAANAVVVAFARTADAASAGAFPLKQKAEAGTDTDTGADTDTGTSSFSA
jgi:hypothetical protein